MDSHTDSEKAQRTPQADDDGAVPFEEEESQAQEDTGDPDYPVPGD